MAFVSWRRLAKITSEQVAGMNILTILTISQTPSSTLKGTKATEEAVDKIKSENVEVVTPSKYAGKCLSTGTSAGDCLWSRCVEYQP